MSADKTKQVVAAGYDQCARAYAAARSLDVMPELDMLAERLAGPARILDVGCGAGLPVTAALARMGTVLGVDISAAQVELARQHVPSARIIHGDVMAQAFERGSFDAAVAINSVFHLPRAEQSALIARLADWIRPGGYLLGTFADTDEPGYTEPLFGVTMYWSHHDLAWYAERLVECGFDLLHQGTLGTPQDQHPLILARRRLRA